NSERLADYGSATNVGIPRWVRGPMRRQRASSFVHDRGGAVSLLTAVSLAALLMVAAIVIDVGSLYFARRALQSTNDAAALAAVKDPAAAASVPGAVFARTGYASVSLPVDTGVYTPNATLTAEQRFVVGNVDVNAVRVRANIQQPGYFPSLFGLSKLTPLA